ncbi:MAG: hypothetical protein KAH20_02935 [Methylococcales bacterium]|nr:hypothetical protein [Methylococcales bacterium]
MNKNKNKNILFPLLLLNLAGTIFNISVAGVQNVSKVVVRPSTLTTLSQRYLQVSEVVATEKGTGIDLALSSAGATAIGESAWPNSSANYAIDGIKPAGYPNMYHPASGHYSSYLIILLDSPSDLASLSLFGRADCCSHRDRYNVELYDADDNLLFSQNNLDARGSSHSASINLPNIPHVTTDTPATNFNCVENGTHGITGRLYTKTTAQSFSFDIAALKNTNTIETNFANGADHTVTVELVDANSGNGSCSNFSVLSPAVSQSLLFTSSDSGIKASSSFSSNTAYQAVKCRVTDNTNDPSVVGCSTDSFSIRPVSFTVSSNLTNTGFIGIPKAKAGEYFTLTATAVKGYTGTPSINPLKIEAHSGSITEGNISGSFNAGNFATGSATNTVFKYSEVGLLRFIPKGIFDESFTSVDQTGDCTNNFSNTVVSGKVGCKFGNTSTSNYFGRFTPDHFDVTLTAPVFIPSCSSFTYLDQPIKYSVNPIATVLAKNASGTITQNYTGNYWKVDPLHATFGFTPTYTESSHTLTVINSNAPVVTDNGDGTGLLTFADTTNNILAVTKNNPIAPFDAEIALSFNLSDTDAIVVANVEGVAHVNPVKFGDTSAGNGISFSASNKSHQWGRVSLDNVHGSELTPLSVPLYTEYYNGSSFIKNTADNCTTFSFATDFSISDAKDFNCSFTTQSTPVVIGSGSVKATLSSSTVNNGETSLIISDNINITKGSGSGNTGHIDITTKYTNLPWLLHDWDGNSTHDNCPSARATFGIYKGNKKQIYFREVY